MKFVQLYMTSYTTEISSEVDNGSRNVAVTIESGVASRRGASPSQSDVTRYSVCTETGEQTLSCDLISLQGGPSHAKKSNNANVVNIFAQPMSTSNEDADASEQRLSFSSDMEHNVDIIDNNCKLLKSREVTSEEEEEDTSTEKEWGIGAEVQRKVTMEEKGEVSAEEEREVATEEETEVYTEEEKEVSTEGEKEVSTEEEKEVSTEVEKEVSTEVEKEVSPEVEKEVSPEVEKEVSTEVEKEVSTEVEKEVSTEVEKEVSTEVEKEVSTEVEKEVSPEVKKEVSTEVEKEVSTEVEKEVSPEVKKEVSPEVEKEVPTEVEKEVSTKEEDEVTSEEENEIVIKEEKEVAMKEEKEVAMEEEGEEASGSGKVSKTLDETDKRMDRVQSTGRIKSHPIAKKKPLQSLVFGKLSIMVSVVAEEALLLPLRSPALADMLDNPHAYRAIALRCSCELIYTRRIIVRKLVRWTRYAVLLIRGPSVTALKGLRAQLEAANRAFIQAVVFDAEKPRPRLLTAEHLPDNLALGVCSERTGRSEAKWERLMVDMPNHLDASGTGTMDAGRPKKMMLPNNLPIRRALSHAYPTWGFQESKPIPLTHTFEAAVEKAAELEKQQAEELLRQGKNGAASSGTWR